VSDCFIVLDDPKACLRAAEVLGLWFVRSYGYTSFGVLHWGCFPRYRLA